jgi:hypothetical protein
MDRHRTGLFARPSGQIGRALVGGALLVGCAEAHVDVDVGADAGDAMWSTDAGLDVGAAPSWYSCRYDPSPPEPGGFYCGGSACASTYQRLVDAGRAFGFCVVPSGAPCRDACAPASQAGIALDGGVAVRELPDGAVELGMCCGDGVACTCDQVCWSPDGVEPPHCVPSN